MMKWCGTLLVSIVQGWMRKGIPAQDCTLNATWPMSEFLDGIDSVRASLTNIRCFLHQGTSRPSTFQRDATS